jgi:Ala-tRNA(Pro) deacylase
MMEDKQSILELLDELKIPYHWIEHPAVFTVAESSEHLTDKRPIKCLLLQEKGAGRKVLVIMAGEKRLDTKLIARELDTRKLQFADPGVLLSTMGVTPGAVSVFGLIHSDPADLEVVLDMYLLAESELGFHPNDNTATVFIPGGATTQIIEKLGHRYHVMDLT